eukprot:jgi/Chrzof1/6036/Cz17g03070.t1
MTASEPLILQQLPASTAMLQPPSHFQQLQQQAQEVDSPQYIPQFISLAQRADVPTAPVVHMPQQFGSPSHAGQTYQQMHAAHAGSSSSILSVMTTMAELVSSSGFLVKSDGMLQLAAPLSLSHSTLAGTSSDASSDILRGSSGDNISIDAAPLAFNPLPGGGDALPPLARELNVSVASLIRLFKADIDVDYEQPVWMVVNLQGKIKGSYTADKMTEFCKRGTLSARQMVLGIDKNLPYVLRQDLAYYRPLGRLAVAIHEGGSYCPLNESHLLQQEDGSLGAFNWTPVVARGVTSTSSNVTVLAASGGLGSSGALQAATGSSSVASLAGDLEASPAEGRRATADAQLRTALQRLFGGGVSRSFDPRGGGGGARQPLWLYINHLGWCRGPFSGAKLMHAHLCGRLPKDTLVVGYDPGVPAFMLNSHVAYWFRPLGALLDNMASGWLYQPVTWPNMVQRAVQQIQQMPIVPHAQGSSGPPQRAAAGMSPHLLQQQGAVAGAPYTPQQAYMLQPVQGMMQPQGGMMIQMSNQEGIMPRGNYMAGNVMVQNVMQGAGGGADFMGSNMMTNIRPGQQPGIISLPAGSHGAGQHIMLTNVTSGQYQGATAAGQNPQYQQQQQQQQQYMSYDTRWYQNQ